MMSSCLSGLHSFLLALLGHGELNASDGTTKNTELDDEHWCLFEICEIPKSDLQITNKKIFQYSKEQK